MDQNIELLKYLYKNSEMGIFAMTELLKNIENKENKIKPLIEKELKEYEKYFKKTKKYLEKYDVNLNQNNFMAKMMSSLGIKKESLIDNSDSALASMIIEGTTMGIVEIEAKIKNYKNVVENKYISLAKDYLKILNLQIKELKLFL